MLRHVHRVRIRPHVSPRQQRRRDSRYVHPQRHRVFDLLTESNPVPRPRGEVLAVIRPHAIRPVSSLVEPLIHRQSTPIDDLSDSQRRVRRVEPLVPAPRVLADVRQRAQHARRVRVHVSIPLPSLVLAALGRPPQVHHALHRRVDVVAVPHPPPNPQRVVRDADASDVHRPVLEPDVEKLARDAMPEHDVSRSSRASSARPRASARAAARRAVQARARHRRRIAPGRPSLARRVARAVASRAVARAVVDAHRRASLAARASREASAAAPRAAFCDDAGARTSRRATTRRAARATRIARATRRGSRARRRRRARARDDARARARGEVRRSWNIFRRHERRRRRRARATARRRREGRAVVSLLARSERGRGAGGDGEGAERGSDDASATTTTTKTTTNDD